MSVCDYERRTRGLVPRPHRCRHGDMAVCWWLQGRSPQGSSKKWLKFLESQANTVEMWLIRAHHGNLNA